MRIKLDTDPHTSETCSSIELIPDPMMVLLNIKPTLHSCTKINLVLMYFLFCK